MAPPGHPHGIHYLSKGPGQRPREFADRFFTVRSWQEFDHGGHFAAWGRPDDYLRGVRAAIGSGYMRPPEASIVAPVR